MSPSRPGTSSKKQKTNIEASTRRDGHQSSTLDRYYRVNSAMYSIRAGHVLYITHADTLGRSGGRTYDLSNEREAPAL